jgi:hypothetical protein
LADRSTVMSDKIKEQLSEELSAVQKMLEERTEARGEIIRKFQEIILNEGLFSQIVDLFPYPMVVYTPTYRFKTANRAFFEAVNRQAEAFDNQGELFDRHKAADIQLIEASRKVFSGKSIYIQNLKDPFSLFTGTVKQNGVKTEPPQSAVVFPVLNDKNEITHGVIVFLPHSV